MIKNWLTLLDGNCQPLNNCNQPTNNCHSLRPSHHCALPSVLLVIEAVTSHLATRRAETIPDLSTSLRSLPALCSDEHLLVLQLLRLLSKLFECKKSEKKNTHFLANMLSICILYLYDWKYLGAHRWPEMTCSRRSKPDPADFSATGIFAVPKINGLSFC